MSGPIEVTNLHPEPHARKKCGCWKGVATENGDNWRYELAASASNGTAFAWQGMTNTELAGKVLYARVISDNPNVLDRLTVENGKLLVRRDGWVAARVADGNNSSHTLPLVYGPFVLIERGVYTPADWERLCDMVQDGTLKYPELQRPWFAGDTFPTTGVGYLFLSVIHMLTSLWGWRHERGRGDHEPVCDAVRDAQNHLLVEYGCSARTVRQMVIHDTHRIAAEWHIRVPDGLQHENGRRRAGVRVLVRPARPDDRAAWHVAASHLGNGDDRGRGRFGADGLGSRTARGHERSARIVGAAGSRMAHIGGLCRVQRGRLAAGAQAPRRRRPADGVVRTTSRRGQRRNAPPSTRAIAHSVASRWEMAAW